MSLCSVHFCAYKEKFISLYCRLSSVLDLDALITQQALREAITDAELLIAKQRHQHILDYIQVFLQNTRLHPILNQFVSLFFFYSYYFFTHLWLQRQQWNETKCNLLHSGDGTYLQTHRSVWDVILRKQLKLIIQLEMFIDVVKYNY